MVSKRLVGLACIVMIAGIVAAPAAFADTIITAVQSCRTDVLNPATNRHDASKLSCRSDASSAKSWIKFDLTGVDVGSVKTATLTVTLIADKATNRNFDVSYVNDNCLDNIGWTDRDLTWNNAPGNNTTDYRGLDASKTTFIATTNFNGGVAGQSFTIDVLKALQTDTDGIVQFVIHNANVLMDFATHDHATVAWRPVLTVTLGPTGQAKKPNPASGATDVPPDAVLGWSPGKFAVTHDVYLGVDFNDVNNASRTNPLSVLVAKDQDANTYAPGVLKYGQTYYWRIDEVNAAPDKTVYKGAVWSFTAEALSNPVTNITATASSTAAGSSAAATINGSGLTGDLHGTDGATMWSTVANAAGPAWIRYDFDRLYKLYEMWVWNYNADFEYLLGFGMKNIVVEYSLDGTTWTTLGNYVLPQGPSTANYAHNATISLGVAAKSVRITASSSYGGTSYGLSEVRFYSIPVQARQPQPATGAQNIDISPTLSWRAGREAVSHEVYLGTDPNALTLSGTVTTTSYTASLNLGTTYYWRVDEVNSAATPSTWASDVWNFTTLDFLVVDDMESYTADEVSGKTIYQAWADGYSTPATNGSVVGYGTATNGTFGETVIIHGGKQSMPFAYGQSAAATSEATRTFADAQDWSKAGITTLTLYFYGDPANAAVQFYVKINGTKIVYNGDAGNIQRKRWNQWNVDLSAISASALKSVKTLAIGDSGTGKGMLFIDDIRLYRVAPVVPVAANPGTTGLIAYYGLNNNVLDGSGNGYNGTLVGTPTYVASLSAFGSALKLNGTTDSVDLGNKPAFNPSGSFSVSLWAYSTAWTTAWGHVMVSNRGETDAGGWQIRRYNATTSMSFTTRGVGNDDMQSVGAMPQNEWVHIACVYDNAGNTKRIYINGIQDSVMTTTAGAKITATSVDTYIGARAITANTGQEAWFAGNLDEIRLFNRALSAGEVEYLSDPTP